MVTPALDKKAIFERIVNDNYLKNTMKINRKYVLRQMDLPNDFDPNAIYILIYEKPSGDLPNDATTRIVYSVEVLTANTAQKSIEADLIIEQIYNLLNEYELSKFHTIRPLRMLGGIAVSQATQYSTGAEFEVVVTKYGKIKT